MTIKVALEVRINGEGGGIKYIGLWQGLLGESTSNTRVVGVAKGAIFLVSMLKAEHGLQIKSTRWLGVYGESQTGHGVWEATLFHALFHRSPSR